MRPKPTVALLFIASLSACHDEVVVDDACGEPAYGGKATDEAWLTILDGYDLAKPSADAATLVSPTNDAVLTGDPEAIVWTTPLDSAMLPPGGYTEPSFIDQTAAVFAALFTSPARAHLPPVNGDIHYLELKVPGESCAIRALTTDETWTPTDEAWELMRGKGPITLTLTSAFLANNRITEGPFRVTSRFEVE